MSTGDKNINDRPEAYPHPTETDEQLKNQPEYVDQQPNSFSDKSISDVPVSNAEKLSNDPETDRKDSNRH